MVTKRRDSLSEIVAILGRFVTHPLLHCLMRILLVVLSLTLPLASRAVEERRLRIGVEYADNPISFTNAQGQPDGFTAALVQEMSAVGLGPVELMPAPWTLLMRDFLAGKIDVLANVAITEERQRDMDFSISHAFVHGLVYTRRDQPPLLKTADFPGKTIGTLAGSIAYANAVAHNGWGAKIVPFISPQAAMDAVSRGECDAVLLIYGLEGKYITNTHGMRREFVDDILHYFRFAVRKGDTATLLRLNDALASVRHNGTFDRIYDKWIGPIEPHPIRLADLRPHAKSIALGILAIAAIIWWQRHMLARVSRHARALHESEDRFRSLVDSAFQGWIIHHNGTIVMANGTFASTFGYLPAELVGKPVLEITAASARDGVAKFLAAGDVAPYETIGRRKDGTEIPIQTAGRACTFEGQPARITGVRDLTAEKQAANDQLVLSKLESTGVLAGGLAHDFNNLLATIVLSVEMAAFHRESEADSARHLASAKQAAASAKALTQQLITFAQGGSSLHEPTELPSLLQRTVPLALSGSHHRAEIVTAPGLWLGDIDGPQIERVISNLVLNAREAMPSAGVITVRAENVTVQAGDVAGLPAGDFVRVDVIDCGHGIPADVLPKIFDPYFSTKQRGVQKGMGLGLTISHSVVHQHGGALTVESRPDVGTTFHVHLPAARQANPTTRTVPPVTALSATRRTGSVLVMDDEAELRELVRAALEGSGYIVALAADGAVAIELYKAAKAKGTPFDSVLLDLTVRGGMGGLQTIRALLLLDPAVNAVVMSGYAQEAVLRDFAVHGFRAALAKPFDVATLRSTMSKAMHA